jgi:hypothetical protein
MTNAKEELLGSLKNRNAVMKCGVVVHDRYFGFDEDNRDDSIVLKLNHNAADLEEFLTKLDFEYDSGYGGQELYGTIWLDDGTWLSRGEYDGSEWWEHNVLPEIPNECL